MSRTTFRVAVCSLNQLSLDFEGNKDRIIRSIYESQQQGACVRIGPELEISGYSCEDAFFEQDTSLHSFQVLAEILKQDFTDILIDVGMCLIKDSSLYNCRVLILNKKIVLIRPKTKLAGDGNYREDRWFTAWSGDKTIWIDLPSFVSDVTGQKKVPFGADVILNLKSEDMSLRLGLEICEELWRADASHISLFLERGVHMVCNSSGSYWEIRKLDFALTMMQTATARLGGAYAFSNLVGCDGSRLCFSGRSLVSVNGDLLARTSETSDLFSQVQVAVADVDVQAIDAYRALGYRRPRPDEGVGDWIDFDAVTGFAACDTVAPLSKLTISFNVNRRCGGMPSKTMRIERVHLSPSEEIHYYASLWLWDYLRRSSMEGFIVPLSGGADSSAVACIIYGMCTLIWAHLQDDACMTPRIRRLLGLKPADKLIDKFSGPKDLCHRLLLCVYLKTQYSGEESGERAKGLAHLLGAQFRCHDMNPVYELMLQSAVPPITGSDVSLQQQNLQARLRMVHTYLFAGNRLVLSTGNVDEALVGYLTKYDCSSGDLNPIGGISKQDLRRFLKHCEDAFFHGSDVLRSIIQATPSAELTGADQADEEDLKLTYEQLSLFGRFRKGKFGACGPFSMFCQLWAKRHELPELRDLTAASLAEKVKHFFSLHARTRHKSTVLTPALHAETYSPDDNRFDHRQFLFNCQWTWQFRQIDEKVEEFSEGK